MGAFLNHLKIMKLLANNSIYSNNNLLKRPERRITVYIYFLGLYTKSQRPGTTYQLITVLYS